MNITDKNNWTFKGFLTQQDQVVAYNVSLDRVCITGGVLDGTWIGRSEAKVQHVRSSADETTLQLQARLDYLKCVCISLRQVGPDVVAHVNWAAYTSADYDVGYDFSAGSDARVMIATSPDADGYGVSELYFSAYQAASNQGDGSTDICCAGPNSVVDAATGAAAIGGAAACATGLTAAVVATTVPTVVTTIGTVTGSAVGGVVGSMVGIAGFGTAIPGTIPGVIVGGSLGCHAATAVASALGLATAPAWAVPVAVCGGVAALGAGVFGLGRHCRWW